MESSRKNNPKTSNSNATLDHVFIFVVRTFLSSEINDLPFNGLHFYYVQGVWDVLRGNYPCSNAEAISLAACQLQATFGDKPTPDNHVSSNGRAIFSRQAIDTLGQDMSKLKSNLAEERKKISQLSVGEAEKKYLELLRQNKLYGSTFFPATERDKKEDGLLSVSENGITFVHTFTRQPIKKTIKLEEITESVVTASADSGGIPTLTITAGQGLHKKVHVFDTKQADTVKELISSYTDEEE